MDDAVRRGLLLLHGLLDGESEGRRLVAAMNEFAAGALCGLLIIAVVYVGLWWMFDRRKDVE